MGPLSFLSKMKMKMKFFTFEKFHSFCRYKIISAPKSLNFANLVFLNPKYEIYVICAEQILVTL